MIEDEYPDMDYYLALASDIVINPDLESGFVKVLARNHVTRTSTEKQSKVIPMK
jgi:hypothetical protein